MIFSRIDFMFVSHYDWQLRLHLHLLINQKGAIRFFLIGQEMQTQTQLPIVNVIRALSY